MNRRDVMKALTIAGAATWLPPERALGFAASGNAALQSGQEYSLGELLPFACWCEAAAGMVLKVGKVVKAERQHDGAWWYDVELQPGKDERIPEEIWNELVVQASADKESGEVIRYIRS
ncbi:MAG: hypothetical protein K2Z80_30375 [Xanthobacteraceae bacterium]|nr:hypothetical protein [Xanthobacteraceae bacterium]